MLTPKKFMVIVFGRVFFALISFRFTREKISLSRSYSLSLTTIA